ncbi:hypothetical protein [Nitrobacter sp. TKz-YC01]|uniref:hypothetical protein n=1 Tax=Nitrobacter sp. TKz-YC01 TaxID=3398703 RepID=UPI003A100CBB
MKQMLYPLFILTVVLAGCGDREQQTKANSPNDWLVGAPDDAARFALLQRQLRGFDQPMWEVGERFERVHAALERGNYPLATYHWEKIRTTIENGIVKRPKRRENAEAMFLELAWGDVDADLKSGDPARAWAAFERAKAACQDCHQAEQVPFLNDQPVFDLAAPTSGVRQ